MRLLKKCAKKDDTNVIRTRIGIGGYIMLNINRVAG